MFYEFYASIIANSILNQDYPVDNLLSTSLYHR
jgi:hypothetical protein